MQNDVRVIATWYNVDVILAFGNLSSIFTFYLVISTKNAKECLDQ